MLKLESWCLHAVELPYFRPVTWSDRTETGAPLLLLQLVATNGAIGVAEVTVKPSWYGVSYRSLIGALEEIFLPLALTIDLSDPDAFPAAAAAVPENQIAKALIDNALWDLRAMAQGQALRQQWQGDDRVDVSWLLTRQSPSRMALEAVEMVGKFAFRTIKLKGGQGIETDVQAIREVRAAIGEQVRMYVDANWHYSADEAVDYVNRLAALGVEAVEDPYAIQPDRRFADIQAKCHVPILVDYFSASLRDAKLFGERGAQALSLKPARVGLSDCLNQARFAETSGIRVHVGFGGESSLGTLAALHLAASLECRKRWLPAEVTFFLMMREDLLLAPLKIEDGAIQLPPAASTAMLVDFEKIKRFSVSESRGGRK